MPIRCLIIEDEYFTRDVLSLTLRRANIEVDVVDNGEMALEYLQTHTPDVLIVDLHMPKVSGYEVINAVRADDRFQNTVIIIITANSSAISSPEAKMADAFIIKPFDIKKIVETVKQFESVRQS